MNSFKFRPIVFLIVFPFLYSFSFLALPALVWLNPENFDVYIRFIPLIFLFISIEYSVIPVRRNVETFFNNHGLERSIHDFIFLKKLLYIIIPIMIFLIIITNLWFQSKVDFENYFFSAEYFFNSLTVGVMIILLSTSSRLGIQLMKRGFRYQFSKICFSVCRKKDVEIEKIPLLILGVNSYNFHLKRHYKLEISEPGRILSKFISDSEEQQRNELKSISVAFSKNKGLEPLHYFRKLLKIESTEQFVIETRFINDVKEWLPFAVGIISGIIAITQFILGKILI